MTIIRALLFWIACATLWLSCNHVITTMGVGFHVIRSFFDFAMTRYRATGLICDGSLLAASNTLECTSTVHREGWLYAFLFFGLALSSSSSHG